VEVLQNILFRSLALHHLLHKDRSPPIKYFEGQYFIHKEIEANLTTLKTILGKSADIIFREFIIGVNKQKYFSALLTGWVTKN